ncbi:MAG: phosphate acyltransferase PlsX [Oscillospiraceae bacterium]|nr:phosphate acyltransferase PlsX [Oscillospiraceae bacterium]
MKIIVDAMGGDNAPDEIVRGALRAAKELELEIMLVGRGEDVLKVLEKNGMQSLPRGVEIAHAQQVITAEDNPATAFREKKDSSLTVALNFLREGAGDAVVSAGATGAILSAATLLVKRIKGIRRAALAPVVPTGQGSAVLIDCGANLECTPEYLLQFAYMGSYYAERVLNRPEPRVGLLNIGTEAAKGTPLHREAYALLREAGENGKLQFLGNVEAREAALGQADVIVADGFSGNIFLKAMEGTGWFFGQEIKKMFTKNAKTKLAYLGIKEEMDSFKKVLDYRQVGGTALLGVSKPVIKAHGSSDAVAILNAIRQAAAFAGSKLIADLSDNVAQMRTGGAGSDEESEKNY